MSEFELPGDVRCQLLPAHAAGGANAVTFAISYSPTDRRPPRTTIIPLYRGCPMVAWGHFGLGELYGRKYGRTRHWRLSEVWGAEHTGACGL
jgi:hypothetical protein